MQCAGCEMNIEEAVRTIKGVQDIRAVYLSNILTVSYDSELVRLDQIQRVCRSKGYTFKTATGIKNSNLFRIGVPIIFLAFLFLSIVISRKFGHLIKLPEINSQTAVGMIFILGLLTGLHCVGMCGSFLIGINTHDPMKGGSIFRAQILYGAGKTLSYTLFGALFGFIGSLFHITPLIGGISISLAGLFLIICGLNTAGLLLILRILHFKKAIPKMHFSFIKNKPFPGSFLIGLFSGLILGCGPLQAMYIMAAGNGDVMEGARLLFFFGLGTLPALFGFGVMTRLLTKSLSQNFVRASGIILIIMGSIMLHKGIMKFSLSEFSNDSQPKCHCINVIKK